MKKILVSLMLLVMTALSAHAQFEKDVWYVNASLTGLDLSHSKNEGTNFGFALTGGAFVADNVAVLLNFKGNYVEHGMDETSIGTHSQIYITFLSQNFIFRKIQKNNTYNVNIFRNSLDKHRQIL